MENRVTMSNLLDDVGLLMRGELELLDFIKTHTDAKRVEK